MSSFETLEPYQDCVILHKDGSQRIGRLNHDRRHFQLASYQTRKVEVVWPVKDVRGVKVIEMFPNGGDHDPVLR